MIKVDCPKCGESWEVPDELAGRTERCTKCNTEVTVSIVLPQFQRQTPGTKNSGATKVDATLTEGALRILGGICIMLSIVAFIAFIGRATTHGVHEDTVWTWIAVSAALLFYSIPLFALSHILMYLRRIASAAETTLNQAELKQKREYLQMAKGDV